jgi:glyoxylase-like metal-dependent hydrolase (beta-lactamase superfamily II)
MHRARTIGGVSEPFLPPLVRELPAGVLRARLPTPFAVGTVNCYVLVEPPVTVVDPGTVTPASLECLRAMLDGAGCSLDDVEQVVVTHAHPDHFGAAAWVARHSGSVILAGRAEVAALRGEEDGEQRSAMMTAFGVPASLIRGVAAAWRLGGVVEWADRVTVVPVDDGDVIHAGGRVLTANVTAGHAPGHLSLWCDDAKLLVSGDHLLARIVPLPGLEPSSTGTGHRHSLDEYLSSLPRFVALDPAVVLPGHGEAFTGVGVLARRLEAHHADRCATVRAVVAELGHPTPFDVAQQLLWNADGNRLLRGVAEVVGHLDLLEHDGDVVADAEGPLLRYRATF